MENLQDFLWKTTKFLMKKNPDEESTKFLQSLSSSFDVPLLSSKGGVEAIRYRIIQCAKDGTGFLLNAADEFNVVSTDAIGDTGTAEGHFPPLLAIKSDDS